MSHEGNGSENGIDEGRRSFLEICAHATTAGLVTLPAIAATGYLITPATMEETGIKTEVDVSDLEDGKPIEKKFKITRKNLWRPEEVITLKAWMYKSGDKISAYHPSCTHLGCTYAHDPGTSRFRCPCHGAVFKYDGSVEAGPPDRPLDQFYLEPTGNGKTVMVLAEAVRAAAITQGSAEANLQYYQDRMKSAIQVKL